MYLQCLVVYQLERADSCLNTQTETTHEELKFFENVGAVGCLGRAFGCNPSLEA
jgi:hypothetical protein